jgi:hypothetical protein
MHEGAMRSSSAPRGRGSFTRMTVFPETESRGTQRREMPRSGRTSALRAGYGLEQSHTNAAWRAGAMDGGSTASFRCRRIFWMTLPSVIAAMIRSVP